MTRLLHRGNGIVGLLVCQQKHQMSVGVRIRNGYFVLIVEGYETYVRKNRQNGGSKEMPVRDSCGAWLRGLVRLEFEQGSSRRWPGGQMLVLIAVVSITEAGLLAYP